MLLSYLTKYRPRSIFIGLVIIVYTAVFFASSQLQSPLWGDEARFYEVSQDFSHQLIPSFEQLRNYRELNTPLPFILYGQIQYLWHGGLWLGRAFTFLLSLAIAGIIGWPRHKKHYGSILALIGLLLCPYFLWFSTLYYTDIIASFFGLLGISLYLKKHHIGAGIAFLLAIASRQFMLAIPVAVACHELKISIQTRKRPSLSFFLPAAAALSILCWVLLFGGLAPSGGLQDRPAPSVQFALWAIDPKSSLYALACVSLFYVIPEWLLFNRSWNWTAMMTRTNAIISAVALSLVIIFPPYLEGKGMLWKFIEHPSIQPLAPFLMYILLVFVFIRFSQPDLMCMLVCSHSLVMLKSFPWDKYVLPLLIVLWFLKARTTENQKGASHFGRNTYSR